MKPIILSFWLGTALMGYELLWLKYLGAYSEWNSTVLIFALVLFGGAVGALAVARIPQLKGYIYEFCGWGLILAFLSMSYYNHSLLAWSSVQKSLLMAFGATMMWGVAQAALLSTAESVRWLLVSSATGILVGNSLSLALEQYQFHSVGRWFFLTILGVLFVLNSSRRLLRNALAFVALLFVVAPAKKIGREGVRLYSNAISSLSVRERDISSLKTSQIYGNELSVDSSRTSARQFIVSRNSRDATIVFSSPSLEDMQFLKFDEIYPLIDLNSGSAAIIGAGGGREILMARLAGYSKIAAIEINPLMVQVTKDFKSFEHSYGAPEVETEIQDVRKYFRQLPAERKFDLIVLSNVRNYGNPLSLFFAQNYTLTKEAFTDYLDHLAPRGVLVYRMFQGSLRSQKAHLRSVMESFDQRPLAPRDEVFLMQRQKEGWSSRFMVVLRRGGFLPAEKTTLVERFNHPDVRLQFLRRSELQARVDEYRDEVTDDRPFPYSESYLSLPAWLGIAGVLAFLAVVWIFLIAPDLRSSVSVVPEMLAGFAMGFGYIGAQALGTEMVVFHSGEPLWGPGAVVLAMTLMSLIAYLAPSSVSPVYALLITALGMISSRLFLSSHSIHIENGIVFALIMALIVATPFYFSTLAWVRLLDRNQRASVAGTAHFLAVNGLGIMVGAIAAKLLHSQFGMQVGWSVAAGAYAMGALVLLVSERLGQRFLGATPIRLFLLGR